ncbi:MAG: hypothetical protein JW807_08135 [Spirochaetes bacterium]|nr:hypothetical protein [Spirochaetota bacterium]
MKLKGVIAVLSCLFLVRCATYYHFFSFTQPKSVFYTEQEKEILDKTTRSIDFDYGFDQDLELDYVYPVSQGYAAFKTNDREMAKALNGIGGETLMEYAGKMYLLKKKTIMKMEKYGASNDWSSYTFINKYLLPPLDHYSTQIEKQAIKRGGASQHEIENLKKAVDKKVKIDKMREEFEEIWKNDYNS